VPVRNILPKGAQKIVYGSKLLKSFTTYWAGQGLQVNQVKEAAKWFRLLTEQGHFDAQFMLGHMFHIGKGVAQDYVQAHKWYNIAGSHGKKIGKRSGSILEKRMTPNQIAEAQKLAREWMEKHNQR